jgi:cytochrome b561
MGAGMRPFSTMQIVIIWIINNVFEYILCITDGISWMEVVYIYSTTSMSLFYVHCHAGLILLIELLHSNLILAHQSANHSSALS